MSTNTISPAAPDGGGNKKAPVLWVDLGPVVAESTEHLPEQHQEPIRWLYAHAMDHTMTLAETARAVGLDGATLHKVLNGKYGAGVAGVSAKIGHYRALFEQRAEIAGVDFVTTETTTKIWKGCDWARVSQSITMIFGDSQIGKTESLMEYAARSEAGKAGNVRFVRMPASGNSQLMLGELMDACNLGTTSTFEKMRRAVLGALDHRQVLVIDELHQAFLTYKPAQAIACLEILREIHDRTRCGLVLCGTNVLSREIKTGKMAPMLEQLTRRGVLEIHLPPVPTTADADALAAAYGLTPARGEASRLQDEILRAHGLGKFIKFLKAASSMAAKAKQPIGWEHFLKAHATLEGLKGKDGMGGNK